MNHGSVTNLALALALAGSAAMTAASMCSAQKSQHSAALSLSADSESTAVDVPLPVFPYQDQPLMAHKTLKDEQEGLSDNRLIRPIQLLRARNLLAAGHYEEAAKDYREGLAKWKVPAYYRHQTEHEFALACEKLGNLDVALKFAKASNSDSLLARLYLKEKRFDDALAIADNNILDQRIIDFENHNSQTLSQWLQFRAVLKCNLKQYDDAVSDLKEAAIRYYKDDADSSNTCAHAANTLIERFKLGAPFKLSVANLPTHGKEKVLELVKFLSRSPVPFTISELNRITGADIKLGGEPWADIHQEKKDIHPFDRLEYRTETDNVKVPHLFMVHISIDQCCVPRDEIDSMFPSNAHRIPALSTWNSNDESPYAEAWKLPTGRLFLRFGEGGARVLNYVEFNAPNPAHKDTANRLEERAEYGYRNDNAKKISTLTDAIKIDEHMIDLYVDRARAYCEQGQFAEALADAKRAVSLGGRFYLVEQSIVEEKMGNFHAAVEHQREYIGDRTPGPETATRYTRLAELYVKDKKYVDALDATEKALVDSKERGAALFVKAQAEAGIGDLVAARSDGKAASDYYFDNAEIMLRDRVLEWLKTIPSET